MNDSEPQNTLLIWLLVGTFPIIFTAFWCFICALLSRIGGWHAMGQRYRMTPDQEIGATVAKYSMQSGRIGWVGYNNIL